LPLLTSQIRPHLSSTLFPYTTLFRSSFARARSQQLVQDLCGFGQSILRLQQARQRFERAGLLRIALQHGAISLDRALSITQARRSEEHTSELQSRENLVCRLLLEKKK